MRVLWIDPWKKWWIVVLDNWHIDWMWSIPKIKWEIDVRKTFDVLQKAEPDHIYFEHVHSVFNSSAKANFQFWYVVWMLYWLCCLLQKPITLVTPKERQTVRKDMDIVYDEKKSSNKKRVKDTKATSLNAANRIFHIPLPEDNGGVVFWRSNSRQSVSQDWLFDAALISHYWYQQLLKSS